MSSSAPMVSHGAMHSLHASAAPAFFRACSRSCCERSSVTAAKAPALRNTFLERLLHLLARAGWKPVVTASSCMTMVAVRSRMGCAAGGRGEPSCLRGAPQISRAVLAPNTNSPNKKPHQHPPEAWRRTVAPTPERGERPSGAQCCPPRPGGRRLASVCS